MIELVADTSDLEALLRGLKIGEQVLAKATASALNKTMVSVRAEMVRMVRTDYAVKAADVRAEIGISKARGTGRLIKLEASIKGEGSPGIPLYRFKRGGKVFQTMRLMSGGYSPKLGQRVKIRKDKGIIPTKGVFGARMRSGHIGLFSRVEGKRMRKRNRQAIEEKFGPSPVKMLASDRYQIPLEDFAGERFDKNMEHEADFFLQKMGLR